MSDDLAEAKRPHIVDGEFQSDKYPACPRGKVPLSTKDTTAQDLLWQYAQRRRSVDAEFADDLEWALRKHGYTPGLDAEGHRAEGDDAQSEVQRLNGLLNTPEVADFTKGIQIEVAHQRERWGAAHDTGKTPADWFWLIGYLAQKAMTAQISGDTDKALHHTISTAAALANWHAAISGANTQMRPGIDAEARGYALS